MPMMLELSRTPSAARIRPCPQCGEDTAWLADARTNAVCQISTEPITAGSVVLLSGGKRYLPASRLANRDDVPRFEYHSKTCDHGRWSGRR